MLALMLGAVAPVQSDAETSHHQTVSSYGALESNYYTNVDGNAVHRPMFSREAPSGASAQCRDGSYSFSQHRRGTCSYHGGVARWL